METMCVSLCNQLHRVRQRVSLPASSLTPGWELLVSVLVTFSLDLFAMFTLGAPTPLHSAPSIHMTFCVSANASQCLL